MSRNPKNDTGITLMPDEANIYVWKGLLQVRSTNAAEKWRGRQVWRWLAGRKPPSAVGSSLWQAQLQGLHYFCTGGY